MSKQAPVGITGIHLYRVDPWVKVAVEVDGRWVVVIVEALEGNFSHIVEPLGIRHMMDGRGAIAVDGNEI